MIAGAGKHFFYVFSRRVFASFFLLFLLPSVGLLEDMGLAYTYTSARFGWVCTYVRTYVG